MTARRAEAFNRFLVDAKSWWMNDAFAALRRDYQARQTNQQTPEQVAALLEPTPLYQYFAWLERHTQKAKYSGRWGLAATANQARPNLLATLDNAPSPDLDADIPVPGYYTEIDTHQHPGNLHGDDLAGFIYRGSAASTQPGSTAGYQLHHRVAAAIAGLGEFRRIADLACGFGKSTLPLAQRFPQAEVVGFDIAAPCLRLAAVEAAESQLRNLAYRQRDVAHTGAPDASFDLVTSTMLLHELPEPAIHDALAETHRLLEPGGLSVHLDFRVADPFLRFIHHGHAHRNNEPYMEAFDRMDVEAAYKNAGLQDLQILPFEETEGAIASGAWRFPWTLFIARKPR